jgi:ribosomal protein S18 acetylase RimI-like enzyme
MIRKLDRSDAAAYREFRLAALRQSPEAFTSNPDDEAQKPLTWYESRIANDEKPDDFVLGAFAETGHIVGIAGLNRFSRKSERHKAEVYGVAVSPRHANQGLGRRLMRSLIQEARTKDGLRQLILSVSTGNTAAEKLYGSLGFEIYGREPRATIITGQELDKWLMVLRLD